MVTAFPLFCSNTIVNNARNQSWKEEEEEEYLIYLDQNKIVRVSCTIGHFIDPLPDPVVKGLKDCNTGESIRNGCKEISHSGAFLGSNLKYSEMREKIKDNIYIDMQADRNLLPKLLVADN